MKSSVFRSFPISLFALCLAASAYATDPNATPRFPNKVSTFECADEGWKIEIKEYDTGQDSVKFSGISPITRILHEVPADWQSDVGLNNGIERGTVVFDATKPQNGRLCATDGSIIGYAQDYVILRNRNRNDWVHTQIFWEGSVSNIDGLNPTDILDRYRSALAGIPNAGPLPSSSTCLRATNACFTGTGASIPDGMGVGGLARSTLGQTDITTMSGQDIYHMLRGRKWGTRKVDLNGLSVNMAQVLANLGYINTSTIVQEVKHQLPDQNGGRFIFRTLQSDFTPELLVVEDIEEDLELIIRPKLTQSATSNGGAWPTNMSVDQSQPRIGPLGKPNPNYCAANDPNASDYIPQYLPDSSVMFELSVDLKYLTNAQTSRIEAMGWDIFEATGNWTDEQWMDTVWENPSLRRPRYDCEIPAQRSTSGRLDEATNGGREGINCKIKDEAYYDGLIDRMIVMNPVLGGKTINHPCNKLFVGASRDLTLPKSRPVVREKMQSAKKTKLNE